MPAASPATNCPARPSIAAGACPALVTREKRVPVESGGAEGTRTPDIRLAKAALSQLSYGPDRVSCAGGPAWNRTRDLSLIRTAL